MSDQSSHPPPPEQCPSTILSLEYLETGEKKDHHRSEVADKNLPRHAVGCTRYECHGAMMEKEGFGKVCNSDRLSVQAKICEARDFIKQYAEETSDYDEGQLMKRISYIETSIKSSGTYCHTFKELEFGCRLAWRNSGRCIMRKVSFTLELLDCREVTTAKKAYEEICQHLRYAFNDGAIKPVISVFPPKEDGKASPIRIWNPQLISYAAYQRDDGTIMGDPAKLTITSLAVKYGWVPPKVKSDFDVLPLLISDNQSNHCKPEVFELPLDCVMQVNIRHPDYDLFDMLNLRWYVLPALSNNAVDIGGIMYQGIPFNGWYSVTEIGRDLLDKQRYDMAEAVAIACDIPRTKLAVWRDDVQLQVHKAILYSFAQSNISIVDHHTASEAFMDFYSDEHKKRRKCPADWVWLVPPAGGSMTAVFHQEMVNYIIKPQYRLQVDPWIEEDVKVPCPVRVEGKGVSSAFQFKADTCLYDAIYVFYGSQTGTALRFATQMASDFDDRCIGPLPLDDLPSLLAQENDTATKKLILVFTSTFGKGNPPQTALKFLPEMLEHKSSFPSGRVFDFGVFALGNSAYIHSFVSFAKDVFLHLKELGGEPVTKMHVADELKNQEESMATWRTLFLDNKDGLIYKKQVNLGLGTFENEQKDEDGSALFRITYRGFCPTNEEDEEQEQLTALQATKELLGQSYSSHVDYIPRSIDLFSFEVDEDNIGKLFSVSPGDHVALYPENTNDVVEHVSCMCKVENADQESKVRDVLRCEIDLHRPLDEAALRALEELVQHERGKLLIGLIIKNTGIDDVFPSTSQIINQLPPKVVSFENFIMQYAPRMSPRFYSISSLNHDKRRLSICQSVFSFPGNQAGTTSRWLRSLNQGVKVKALLSVSPDFHLPKRDDVPLIMIATGSGIAPYRSFWTSKVNNPMHLFFGCRTRSELPFKAELSRLEDKGRLFQYIACSREKGYNKMYVQDLFKQEAELVLDLIHKHDCIIYVCGSPEMEYNIRTRLLTMLSNGSKDHTGMGIVRATEKFVLMKYQKRYIPEVYGTTKFLQEDPVTILIQEAEAKLSRCLAGLDKVGLLKPPHAIGEVKTSGDFDSNERPKKSKSGNIYEPKPRSSGGIRINPKISRGLLIKLLNEQKYAESDLNDEAEYWDADNDSHSSDSSSSISSSSSSSESTGDDDGRKQSIPRLTENAIALNWLSRRVLRASLSENDLAELVKSLP